MQPTLAILVGCLLLAPAADPYDIVNPDGVPLRYLGGFMLIRQGDKTMYSVGGGLLPRHVKVVTATPAGAVVTHFKLNSNFQGASSPLDVLSRPAGIWAEVPDEFSLLYVDGELVRGRGKQRALLSPPLEAGCVCAVRVRVASVIGSNFFVEERQVPLRGGEVTRLTFDVSSAFAVPLSQIEPIPPKK